MSQAVVIPAKNQHQNTIIWLHGLGDQGASFMSLMEDFKFNKTQFILPNAPVRPITLNGGMAMPGWYDIESLEVEQRQDIDGILKSTQYVHQLIQAEIDKGISPGNIILAGFSQGGAIALYAAATFDQALGGIIATSTYLPVLEQFKQRRLQTVPIIMCHGTQDDVVSYEIGCRSRDHLLEMSFPLEWHEYPIPHSLCLEEMHDIKNWIQQRWSDT